MKEKWNFILYLVWFSYLILSAVLMFGHGFLLSRKTLSDISECVPLNNFGCDGRENSTGSCGLEEKIRRIASNPGAPMACASDRNRVVLILVDALRYDFTLYNANIEKPLPYQNRLPVIKETLDKWPERARLYQFMADPPTTTLQRVKALVTGSLPTFVDASSNFAALEIQEDNSIDQVYRNGGRVVLLGDDTWARLMPKRWLRSHALYSFHTWDLDTVDIEVDSKIYDELKNKDWDLLLAHYLGVDHAGHRYGPHHKEMSRKLDETNNRLQRIIDTLPADVLLYVIGDHGMTETGDHGGESRNERTAAFFAYRGSGLAPDPEGIWREVQQTNLAPTLSAALGRPPPAPSLGYVELPLLPEMSIANSLLHLSNNLKQLTQYLVRYGEESQQISLEKLTELINVTRTQIEKASTVTTKTELNSYAADVKAVVNGIRGVFREVWVEFDSLSMLRALLLLLLAIFFNWLITEGLPVEQLPHIFASSFVPTGITSIGLCISLCFTAFYFELIEDLEHAVTLSTGLVSGLLTCSLVIMHWGSISQRWYENRPPLYERFSRAAIVASATVLVSNSYIIEEGAVLSFLVLTILGLFACNIGTVKALALWVGCGAVLAVTRLYRGCREEQGDCWTAGGGAVTEQASRAALVLALGSTSAVVAVARRHLGWGGYGVALAGMLACAHWAVGWGNLGSPARSRLLARIAWLVLATMFLLIWRREGKGVVLPLSVCGLLFYVANALVLGVVNAPAAGLAVVAAILAIYIVSHLKSDGATKFALSARCGTSAACLWALLSSYMFYGSGHHATLGHVRWAPAFHAGDPNHVPFPELITAVLMFIDLFGMPLMFGVTAPLLALWSKNGAPSAGPRTQLAAVFSLCLKFALCFAVRVFAIALSATIHCRHLMIWGVFTPKLLFESGACAAAFLGVILGASITAWHMPTTTKNS